MSHQQRDVGADEGPESRVLCIAEKPSVARAVAEALSGGKHCTRGSHGPLQTHMLYAYFAPARRTSARGPVGGSDDVENCESMALF